MKRHRQKTSDNTLPWYSLPTLAFAITTVFGKAIINHDWFIGSMGIIVTAMVIFMLCWKTK